MAGIPIQLKFGLDASGASAGINEVLNNWNSMTREMKNEWNKALGGSEVTTVVKVIYETDDSGLKQAKTLLEDQYDVLDKLKKEYDKQNKLQYDSVSSLRQQLNTAKQTRDSIARIRVETEGVKTATGGVVVATKKVSEEWSQANLKVQALQKILNDSGSSNFFDRVKNTFENTGIAEFSSGVQSLVGTFQSVAIIVQQVNAAFNALTGSIKQIQAIELTFKSIGQGAEGGTRAFQEASRISQDLGVNLKSTLNGFQQLTPVVLASGGSIENVSSIVESLSSRFVAFGKSADESKRIMNAVIQAFGKGKLMSEELNQQISEADPAFRTDLAGAIGVSVQELGKMVEAGQVTNDMLMKAIPNMGKVSELFSLAGMSAAEAAMALGGELAPTLDQVENKINTINALSLIDFASQFEGLIGSVLVVKGAIADFFAEFSKSDALQGLAAIINDIAQGFAVLTVAVLKVAEVIVGLLAPVGTFLSSLSELNLGITDLGTVAGTLAAVGLVAWFASIGGAALKASADVASFATKLAADIALTANAQRAKAAADAEAAASAALVTAAETGGTAALAANTAAQTVNTGATVANAASSTAAAAADAAEAGARGASATATAAETAALGANTAATAANATASAAAGVAQLDLFDTFADMVPKQLELFDSAKYVAKGLGDAGEAASKSTGLLGGLRNAIASAASGAPILNKSLGDLAKSAATAASTGIQSLITGLTGLGPVLASIAAAAAPILLVAAAIGAIGLAIDTFKQSTEDGDASLKKFQSSTSDLDKAIKTATASSEENAAAAEKVGSGWEGASGRVGGVQAVMDMFRRTIGLTSAEQASYNDELIKSGDGFDQFYNKLQQGYTALDNSSYRIQNNADAMAKAQQLYKSTSSAINEQINILKSKNAEDEKIRAGDAKEQEALQANINQRNSQIQVLEAEKKKLDQLAVSRGLQKVATEADTEALKKNKEALELRQKQIELTNSQKITSLKDKWDEEKAAIDAAKLAMDRKFEDEKMRIDDVKNAEQSRHDSVKTHLDDEKNAINEKYDKEISRLKEIDAAMKEAYDAEIQRYKDPTPAEKQLELLKIADLRTQAAQGATQEERLQAQAALERIDADKKAADLQAQADAEEKQRQAEIKAMEQQKEKELAEIKKQERAEDIAHNATMEQLTKESNDLQKQQIEERRRLQDEEQRAAEQYGPQIKALEKEIQDAKDDTKRAEIAVQSEVKNTGNEISNNTIAQQGFTNEVNNNSRKAIQNLTGDVKNLGTEIRNLPPIPTKTTNFAGGPISAGESTYINELGKEAFLSSSGRLSWINKPAWSTWQAPSSGTIIPAHIAAGMNIPSGGININRSTVRNVSNSVSNGTIDRRAMSKMMQGNGSSVGVINNSVTISSSTPVKSASDMLVELTKLRRNRYY